MRNDLCERLPALAQHEVLGYLNYILRNKKYIKINPLPESRVQYFEKLFSRRTTIEEIKFDDYDPIIYLDKDENDSYFRAKLYVRENYVPGSRKQYSCLHFIEISYSYSDRNKYMIDRTHEIDY